MEAFEREIYAHYLKLGNIRPAQSDPQSVPLDFLLQRYDAFFFDAFGTFYAQKEVLYPGALEMYRKVRATKKPMRLVTNAASASIPQLSESLARMQIPFDESEIISSGSLFPAFARENGIREAFYIGRPGGTSFLEAGGVKISENPAEATVIVSATGKEEALFERAVKILKHPGARLVVLNPDAWAPRIGKPRDPVSGAYAHRLYLEAKPQVFYFGKPFRQIFDSALSTLPRPMHTVMIGDTLATDIGGARNARIDAALLVGRNEPAEELDEDEQFLGIRPNYYLTAI